MRCSHHHFLIWLSETEAMCEAVRRMGVERRQTRLAEATIDALWAAHRDAARSAGGNVFRFRPPVGAEHLMTAAATVARPGPASAA